MPAELATSSFADTHQIVGPSGGAAVAFRKSMFTLKEEQALEGLAEGSDDYRGRGMLAVLSTRRWVPYPSDFNDKEYVGKKRELLIAAASAHLPWQGTVEERSSGTVSISD